MAKGKAPSFNGIVIKKFVRLWLIIGANCHGMIVRSIEAKRFLKWSTKGLIALLYKYGENNDLGNQHPISLLNMAYKIYVKVRQLHLQLILMEVIDGDKKNLPSPEAHIWQKHFGTWNNWLGKVHQTKNHISQTRLCKGLWQGFMEKVGDG